MLPCMSVCADFLNSLQPKSTLVFGQPDNLRNIWTQGYLQYCRGASGRKEAHKPTKDLEGKSETGVYDDQYIQD